MKKKNHIAFYDDTHQYVNLEEDRPYTSVTTWIGGHKVPFIADESKTRATQKREGLTHQQVLDKWAEKNNKSKYRGTFIHNTIEAYLKAKGYEERLKITLDLKENPLVAEIPFDYLDKLLKKKCDLHIEDLLYLDKWGIAGQSDLVLEYKNHIEILDWKTNEKDDLNKVEWYTEHFKALFTDLHQTSYNEYAIQLTLYGMMAELLYKKPCKKHTIVHIHKGDREIVIDKALVKKIKAKLKFLFE